MPSRPEYIKFVDVDAPTRKTRVVEVRSVSSDTLLGTIAWFGAWRQYTFWPQRETTFNVDCMKTIIEKVDRMMDDWRRSKEREREARQVG